MLWAGWGMQSPCPGPPFPHLLDKGGWAHRLLFDCLMMGMTRETCAISGLLGPPGESDSVSLELGWALGSLFLVQPPLPAPVSPKSWDVGVWPEQAVKGVEGLEEDPRDAQLCQKSTYHSGGRSLGRETGAC